MYSLPKKNSKKIAPFSVLKDNQHRMEISLYQIFAPLLAVVMIGKVISRFRRDERTLRELIVQIFFWGFLAITAIFPDFFVELVEKYTGISGVSGILFLSIIVLGLFVIHLLHENEKRAQEITRIVQHLAMQEYKNTGHKSSASGKSRSKK
jgi:hypothetical protein